MNDMRQQFSNLRPLKNLKLNVEKDRHWGDLAKMMRLMKQQSLNVKNRDSVVKWKAYEAGMKGSKSSPIMKSF